MLHASSHSYLPSITEWPKPYFRGVYKAKGSIALNCRLPPIKRYPITQLTALAKKWPTLEVYGEGQTIPLLGAHMSII